MKKKDMAKVLFLISLILLFISAASVFLVSWVPPGVKGLTTIGLTIGILFWSGLLLGILAFTGCWFLIRKNKEYKKIRTNSKMGAISFGKTKYGLAADIGFVISLVIIIIGKIVKFPNIIQIICLFILLYSFYLHFMLNGRSYRYLKKVKEKKNEK